MAKKRHQDRAELIAKAIDEYKLPGDTKMAFHGCKTFSLDVEEGAREVVAKITTGQIDRDGEVLRARGMDKSAYNGTVLFGHQYGELPVGKNLWLKYDKASDAQIAKSVIDEGDFEDRLLSKIQSKSIASTSVGFMPIASHEPDEKEIKKTPELASVRRIYDEWALLEYSFVPVPSNPGAAVLSVSKSLEEMDSKELFDLLGWSEEEAEPDSDLDLYYGNITFNAKSEAIENANSKQSGCKTEHDIIIEVVPEIEVIREVEEIKREFDPELIKRLIGEELDKRCGRV